LYVTSDDYTLVLHVEQRAEDKLYITFERAAVVHGMPRYSAFGLPSLLAADIAPTRIGANS
jgi:hypothetical protein